MGIYPMMLESVIRGVRGAGRCEEEMDIECVEVVRGRM
jgi:hypothetical protein